MSKYRAGDLAWFLSLAVSLLQATFVMGNGDCSTCQTEAPTSPSTGGDRIDLAVLDTGLVVVVMALLVFLVTLPLMVGCVCLVIKRRRRENSENKEETDL